MSKWIKAVSWFCIACVLGSTGNLFAQEDKLIENQRYVVGLSDFSWGNTYVGKYTSGNGLILEEYIVASTTNPVTLTVSSLQIGTETNSGNYVDIYKGGQLTINGGLTILNTNVNEGLAIHNKGTLFMKSDFDAAMDGFNYDSGAQLKVGGEISNLDNVEGGLNFTLTGENATWNFGTNFLTIGELTDLNSVSISNSASLEIDTISIGGAGTSSNGFVVSHGGRVLVNNSIDILGSDNYLHITNDGILAVDFDFDASVGIVDIQEGGILEAHRNLILLGGVTNGGGVIMTGTNANWSNLSGSTLLVGGATDDNFLHINSGATVGAGNIQIGSISNIHSEVLITSGGKLTLEDFGSYINGTNTLRFIEGGRLIVKQDFSAAIGWHGKASFIWGNGGILEAYREAPIFTGSIVDGKYVERGALFLEEGQTLILNGPTAQWSGAAYNLHVGDLSSDNHLIITNGGRAFVNSASIGDFKEGGNHNSITITGTNSLLDSTTYVAIGGTMDSGIWYEGGISNSITVDNEGLLSVGTTLHNRNTTGTSGLNIRPGGIVDAQNYYQVNGAYLNIYTDTSGTNTGLLRVSDTAEFEAGAAVGFDAVASMTLGDSYTNMIVESDTLIVGGVTNDVAALQNTGGSLVNYSLWATSNNIYAMYFRRSIAEGGIEPDSMLEQIAQEIDRLASEGNTAASNQVEILSNMGSDQERRLQMEQMYSYQIPTFMHNQAVLGGIDQVLARGSSSLAVAGNESKPNGAAGPHAKDQGLQGWAQVYGSYGSRDSDDESGFADGYSAQIYGTVFGLDQAFGDWLFGIAGGYAGSMLEGDNNDESEATTGYGILYANYGTKEWFGDLVLSYGLTDIDNTSGSAFDVTSSTKASQSMFYLGGGKEFKLADQGVDGLIRPELGLQAGFYDQDAYTEESPNAVAKDVDAYDRWSARSSLGASLIIPVTAQKVHMEIPIRAFWLHEFNGDEEYVSYTLIDSGLPAQFVLRSPDQDTARIGLGYVSKWDFGLQLRADIDLLISKTYTSTTLSGALLYEF